MNVKKTVADVLAQLPDDCTFEDVQYYLYVAQAIRQGQREIAAGKGIPHREVVRKLKAQWRAAAPV